MPETQITEWTQHSKSLSLAIFFLFSLSVRFKPSNLLIGVSSANTLIYCSTFKYHTTTSDYSDNNSVKEVGGGGGRTV